MNKSNGTREHKKALSSLKHVFNENKRLKDELKLLKTRKKEAMEKLKIKIDKTQLENKEQRRENRLMKNNLKELKKDLQIKIKQHEITQKQMFHRKKRNEMKLLAAKIQLKKERTLRKTEKRKQKQIRKQKHEEKHKNDIKDTYLRILPPQFPKLHDEIIPPQIKDLRLRYGVQSMGNLPKDEHPIDNKNKSERQIYISWFNDITSYEDINYNITKVCKDQKTAFKINLSFGYVFERIEKDIDDESFVDYSLGFAHDDKTILDEPMLIANDNDFKKLIQKINLHDVELFNQSIHIRDTKTKVIGIYQLFIKVFDMKYPIGSNLYLPEIILNSKFIYTALNIVTKKDDKLCFWRCLAKMKYPKLENKKLIKKSKKLFKKYYPNQNINDYSGVDISEFNKIETFFNINIMIYDLTIENNEIIAERKRVCKDTNKLILGLYENHFIQIKDVNKLCKKI